MQNKPLTCLADTCTFNNNSQCYAGKISFGNPSATTTAEARCKTFEKKEHTTFSNDISSIPSLGTAYIHCTAKNCEYNNNKKCKADSIIVNPITASCDTFRSTVIR